MARRKPRKNAGPQPHHGPKKARREGEGSSASARAAAPKRRPGEPHPPSLKGVAIRAAIVSALFYPYLVYIAGHSVAAALIVTGVAFLFMLPLGLVMDRFRYKRQMAKWLEKRGGSAAPKPAKP
ncbi:MAG: hypothetical protein ACLGG9_10515 [Thermoleophilia bacterium]